MNHFYRKEKILILYDKTYNRFIRGIIRFTISRFSSEIAGAPLLTGILGATNSEIASGSNDFDEFS